MTPAQKAQQTAYNEFVADYVERHGECKASRDEAHEVADWIEALSKNVAATVVVFRANSYSEPEGDIADDFVAQLIDANDNIDGKDEAKFLAACAIAAALEVVA